MRTFWIQTLGCKVNQYESEQIATLLRERGMVASEASEADLRIVNTCSVTSESASKSRQSLRRAVRLNVLSANPASSPISQNNRPEKDSGRVIAMGCWATSNPQEAAQIPGVDAVLTHHDNIAQKITHLLDSWPPHRRWHFSATEKPHTHSLPLLDSRHTGHQRAFLKIQDGCDAHCTYCIIPQLRPKLWSKPIDDVVREAQNLVNAGHREIVLTGIFLSAYGQPTALRRRQSPNGSGTLAGPEQSRRASPELSRRMPLSTLLENLCTRVKGLERLRLSSLEPGDLTPDLLHVLRSLPQITPHFHLPLQSGSDRILRKMNRQYTRNQFLDMVNDLHFAYDRLALTTDIITGFPGETDEDFAATLDIVDRAKFIHIHAFPFSPRPGTAAARWREDFVDARVAAERVRMLSQRATECSLEFRRKFIGQTVRIYVEESADGNVQHGRTAWYFPVHFYSEQKLAQRAVDVRIERMEGDRTWGEIVTPTSTKSETQSPTCNFTGTLDFNTVEVSANPAALG